MGAGDVVRQAYKHWNAGDGNGWRGLAAGDCEVEASGGFTGKGPDGFAAIYELWHDAFPDCSLTMRELVTDGDRAMAEATFTGTHTGVLRTPAGEVAPTGRRVDVDYVDAWQIRDGKVVRDRVYFDEVELLTQLGIA
jgi:predicted ester cyclase